MKIILLFIIFAKIDFYEDYTIVDEFTMIEVNHYHNEWGIETFSQLICWDWKGNKKEFDVEYWVMMKDAYEKTKKGEEAWEVKRRKVEAQIRGVGQRWEWLKNSKYRGDFIGGKFYPVKNGKTRYYEVKFEDKNKRSRIIKSKIFRETFTQYDPEILDKKEWPRELRRGLTEPSKKETNSAHVEAWRVWTRQLESLGH